MSTDHNEAMSQHERDSRELRELCAQRDAARATVRQQAERIAELEAMQAGIMQAITDPENQPSQYGTVTLDYLSDKLKAWEDKWFKRDQQANTAEAERDQHQATATALIALLADIRKACGDNGKRMQPELVEFIGSMKAERDQHRAEVERLRADGERLDWLESEADDLRTVTSGEDDYDWIVISHHMAKPHEREVGRAKTARDAIDAARTTHKETE